MTQKVQLWEITKDQSGDKLTKIEESAIELEQQLEDWLAADISVLDPDLLVIGRQLDTDYGGTLDLLCLDSNGDTVVIELKKGMTPREVTAQALDYASWVKNLSAEDITKIANEYLNKEGEESLQAAYQRQFDSPFPEELNLSHRSLIVAESMDASTERIVQYLSDLNVPINVATVQHFGDESGNRILAQVYLIEPQQAEIRAQSKSRRSTSRSISLLQEIAHENGIGELFSYLHNNVRGILPAHPNPKSAAYGIRKEDGGWQVAMSVPATPDDGIIGLPSIVHASRLKKYLGIGLEELRSVLPPNAQDDDSVRNWTFSSEEETLNAAGLKGYFTTTTQIDTFINGLREAQKRQQNGG